MESNLKLELTITQNNNSFSLVLQGTEEEVEKEVNDWIERFKNLTK